MARTIDRMNFQYGGIKKITIPFRDSDFNTADYGWAIIKRYLPNILSTHLTNANKIDYLYNFFLGQQDILSKKRLHSVNSDNNNIIVENEASREVEFKVGFINGEHRDYTHKLESNSDDLTYLNRYFTDCDFFAKDNDLKEWIYITGIGTTHTAPRTDIIISDGIDELTKQSKMRYATKADGYNVEYEAPFTYDCVDPRENFVVYSSATNKQPLMCISFVEIEIDDSGIMPTTGKQLLIETRYATFKFNSDSQFSEFYWNNGDYVEIKPKYLRYLPLIEYSANKDRIGIIEKNRDIFNQINTIRSAISDMVIDNSNAILLFKNVDITADEVKEMRKAGAIVISDTNGALADLQTIKIEIPFDNLTTYIDQLIRTADNNVGVPQASGQVTSGGDTGQARLLGGGWNNAYIVAHKEIQSFLKYDYEQLKLILMFCKQIPECPLDELYASQVDINYRINQNDNFLVKTQGMKYLYDMHCDLEFIMKVVGLSNDIKADSNAWRESIEWFYKNQLEMEKQRQTNTEVIETEKETNNDNGSQE